MSNNLNCWYAIVNPNAGSGKTLAEWRKTEALMYKKRISYKFVSPESPSDARAKVHAACRAGYRRFIAVGGDGTVHHTLNSIVSYVAESADNVALEDFYLAVLPIGSGNDWMRSHNIPRNHEQIIELLAKDSFSPQDVVQVDIFEPSDQSRQTILKTVYMANIGGYCFDANICDRVNFQKAHGVTGKMIYVNALRDIAVHQKSSPTKVICDGEEIFDGMVFTMSLGNGKYSGGGLCQTPSAVMDDGIIDVMMAPKFPKWKLLVEIKKLLTKRIEEISFLKFFKGREIFLEPHEQGQLIEVDGEIIGRAPARIKIMQGRINALHLPE